MLKLAQPMRLSSCGCREQIRGMPTPTVMIGAKAGWEGKAFNAIKASPPLTPEEAVIAMTAAGKDLPKSKDATNEGPLKEHMDYTKADFSKEPAK